MKNKQKKTAVVMNMKRSVVDTVISALQHVQAAESEEVENLEGMIVLERKGPARDEYVEALAAHAVKLESVSQALIEFRKVSIELLREGGKG